MIFMAIYAGRISYFEKEHSILFLDACLNCIHHFCLVFVRFVFFFFLYPLSRISDLRISLHIFSMNNITTVPLHDLEERFFLSGDELEKAWR